jgi:hypothetical protein
MKKSRIQKPEVRSQNKAAENHCDRFSFLLASGFCLLLFGNSPTSLTIRDGIRPDSPAVGHNALQGRFLVPQKK